MQGSRVASAVSRLEPGSRALLDLSLRQGVPDDRIGRVLHTRADDVRRRRAVLIKRLAAELELSGIDDRAELRHELERLPADAWLARRASQPRRARAARRAPVLLACLLAVAAAGWLLAGSRGDGGAQPVAAATIPGPLPGPEANLDRLAGPEAAVARARLVGDPTQPRVELVLAGLEPARRAVYEAWLYNSRANALSLARWRAGEGGLELRLPAAWRSYRWLDVSLEPPGEDVTHNGRSLLRVSFERLLPR